MQATLILLSLKTIALPKAEVSRLRAASAASIVAAVGRSFRLTRSAFSLSPLATKASLPKGLSGRLLETFGQYPCCYAFNAALY